MQAPSGQLTAPALQALLQDGALAGEWILDPSRSTVSLKSRTLWGLAPVNGVAERLDATAAGRRAALAVADLPAEQREVLLLFAWAELDYGGIARALGVSPGTVRSRLHRARQRLRGQLGLAATKEAMELQPTPPGRIDPG